MKYSLHMWLFFGAAIIVVILVMLFTPVCRMVKTGYLIFSTTPYEQIGEGGIHVLVMGDSTAYGTGATSGEYSIAGLIGASFPQITITTVSRNGMTTAGLKEKVSDRKFAHLYDVVLLQIGGNDIIQGVQPAQSEENLKEVIGKISPYTKQLVLMSAGNVGSAAVFVHAGHIDKRYENRSRAWKDMATRLAKEHDLTYINLFTEPHEDVFFEHPDTYLAIDGLHPSNEGYQYWYTSLYPILQDILNKDDQ